MNGVVELIQNAINDRDGSLGERAGYQHLFDRGDLRQLAAQHELLRQEGFEVGLVGVYPAVKTEDALRRGLTLIWERKMEGWWHYLDQYTSYGICTQAQFDAALNR